MGDQGSYEGESPRSISTSLLTRAAQQIEERVNEALEGSGLATDQWRVLTYLAQHRGSTMADVAAGASLNGSTLTRVVDRLVSSALVYRGADPSDRRRILVYLSARGRRSVRGLEPSVAAAEADATAALSAEDVEELRGLLHRVIDARTSTRGAAPVR